MPYTLVSIASDKETWDREVGTVGAWIWELGLSGSNFEFEFRFPVLLSAVLPERVYAW